MRSDRGWRRRCTILLRSYRWRRCTILLWSDRGRRCTILLRSGRGWWWSCSVLLKRTKRRYGGSRRSSRMLWLRCCCCFCTIWRHGFWYRTWRFGTRRGYRMSSLRNRCKVPLRRRWRRWGFLRSNRLRNRLFLRSDRLRRRLSLRRYRRGRLSLRCKWRLRLGGRRWLDLQIRTRNMTSTMRRRWRLRFRLLFWRILGVLHE